MIVGWRIWFVDKAQANPISYASSNTSWDELPKDGKGEKLSADNIAKLEEHAGEMMQQFGHLKQAEEAA